MFDMLWKDPSRWRVSPRPPVASKPFGELVVEAASLLIWSEHCVECAQPLCFLQCPLYEARPDGNCRRFSFGFIPDPSVKGLYYYGVDCEFRKWAKMMAAYNGRMFSVSALRLIDALDRMLTSVSRWASRAVPLIPRHRRPTRIYNRLRSAILSRLPAVRVRQPDAFVLECYSFVPEEIDWILQLDAKGLPIARHRFSIRPGWNREIVDAEALLPPDRTSVDLSLSSARESPFRLMLTWADFVVLSRSGVSSLVLTQNKETVSQSSESDQQEITAATGTGAQTSASPASIASKPAKLVKCVAWDLDNTLWQGVLIEDGVPSLRINEQAIRTIKALDERGIIQTILSKNDREPAVQVIESFGLKEYFVHCAIGWGPKSAGLQETAKRLNIGLDTFAVIDDSPFERAEISETLPMVRVYSEQMISRLLSLPEFDLPITEASRARRLSYLAESKREAVKEEFAGDNIAFLRSCNLTMRIAKPTAESEIARCLELIQRSNQLNLSSRRYDENGFRELLASSEYECFRIRCSDRFGDYGIVGFIAVKKEPVPTIRELVISCRIAKKRCEHALLRWIALRAKAGHAQSLEAVLVRTERNGPLASVFQETPFTVVREEATTICYRIALDRVWEDEGIVSIEVES